MRWFDEWGSVHTGPELPRPWRLGLIGSQQHPAHWLRGIRPRYISPRPPDLLPKRGPRGRTVVPP